MSQDDRRPGSSSLGGPDGPDGPDATEAAGDLGALVGYQLKRAQSALRAQMDETLRPLGLTAPQYACLELVSRHPGASSSDLARGAFVTRQTMSALLRALTERGLVTRASRAASGRALPAALTSEGERLLGRAGHRIRVIERRMVAGLTGEQCEALRRALSQCADAFSGALDDSDEPGG